MLSTLELCGFLCESNLVFSQQLPKVKDGKEWQSLFPCLLSTHPTLPAIVESKKNVGGIGINNC